MVQLKFNEAAGGECNELGCDSAELVELGVGCGCENLRKKLS